MFGLLRLRRASLLLWAGAWWVGIYVLLRFGFTAPIPSSVVTLYMGIVSLAIAAYVTVDAGEPRRSLEHADPVHDGEAVHAAARRSGRRHPGARGRERVREDERAAAAAAVLAHGPSGVAVRDHGARQAKINLDTAENPFLRLERSNAAEYRKHVENGRKVYYRNCVFCHGDNLSGNGMFVHGLDPIPTNFTDGSIAGLRDSFLLWRISKGGPGLPEEGGPVGLGDARLGEDPEGRGDVGRDPLSLRFHRPEATRQGRG